MYKKEKKPMSIYFNLNKTHQIALANLHFYEKPTEPLYLDRTLQYHDLIYLCKGHWMFTESDIDYELNPDDVLLLSAKHHHYTRLPCEPNTHTMCIHVSCEDGDLLPSDSAIQLPIKMHVAENQRVREYFQQIVSTFWENTSHKEARMSTLFNQLILELNDIMEKNTQNRHKPTIADEAIRMICDMPHKRFNTEEVAAALSVHPKSLNNAMIHSTGMSFSKYQTNKKLEMVASQIITEPDIKFSEIASLFGFYDEFHLSRTFKQKYGISPQQYKKEHLFSNTANPL